jgi:serine/threonine protein kinase
MRMFTLVYESREKIILVMDYANGGELYDYLNRMKRISESEARAIFRQIVSAVHFLHQVEACSTTRTTTIDVVVSCCHLESYCSSRFETRKYSHRSKRRYQSMYERVSYEHTHIPHRCVRSNMFLVS